MAASAVVLCGGSPAGLPSIAYGLDGGTLDSVTITPDFVVSGTPAQGTLFLTAPASEDIPVTLSSTNTPVATVPSSVTIPAGATSTGFTVTTIPFTGPGDFACVYATAGDITQIGCLHINPIESGPVLSSVTFSPATVTGGGPATGTVRFATVTDGARVTLTSGDPAVAGVPAEAVVNGGQSSGAFPVTTAAVSAATTVTVTATAFGVTRTGTLTVVPGTTPPASDTVRIKRATWDKRLLRIEATSTNPSAILTVHLASDDSFMFTLTNVGGGRYTDQRGWTVDPKRITVRSNFGGSATAGT